eukprot:6456824-Prorocentrum_lima.AAC.1
MFHPPGQGQLDMELISLCKHCLSDEIKLCPGEVEQISPALQVHRQFTCFSTLDPQGEPSSIYN